MIHRDHNWKVENTNFGRKNNGCHVSFLVIWDTIESTYILLGKFIYQDIPDLGFCDWMWNFHPPSADL